MTSVLLHGCDGTTWDLLDRTSPVTLTAGLGGLHLPKASHRWSSTAARPGRTWKGAVLDARTFTMSVLVGDPQPPFRTGDDWRTLDSQFWQALSYEDTATLQVGDRTLPFRLDEDNDFDYAKDPALIGKAVYPIACIADRPEWSGQPVTATFGYADTGSDNYYGAGAGLGPPFYVGSSGLFDTAAVPNPGDLPAFPVWTITGPALAATVGVAGHTVTLPFPLNRGDVAIIDSEAQTITDSQGNNLWPQMGYTVVDFAPVPTGDLVPVVVGMAGAQAGASVTVDLTPRYRRAW